MDLNDVDSFGLNDAFGHGGNLIPPARSRRRFSPDTI